MAMIENGWRKKSDLPLKKFDSKTLPPIISRLDTDYKHEKAWGTIAN
jgi:hypothetical protein